jgi:hypothetical protein
MVFFQNKNTNLGKFPKVLLWTMLVYFMTIGSVLRLFGIFCVHLVHFVFVWYIFPVWASCTKKNLATLLVIGTFNAHVLGIFLTFFAIIKIVFGHCVVKNIGLIVSLFY